MPDHGTRRVSHAPERPRDEPGAEGEGGDRSGPKLGGALKYRPPSILRYTFACMDGPASRRWIIVLTVLAVMWPVVPAGGQWNDVSFPAPLTMDDVARCAEYLSLSRAQQLAAIAALNTAQRDYRELRDGPIAAYHARFEADPFRLVALTPAETRRAIREHEQIQQRFAEIDATFLMEIESFLTDAQRAKLPRIRTAREIARLEPVARFGVRLHLHDPLKQAELSAKDRAGKDIILHKFDEAYLELLRRRVASNRRVAIRTAEILQEQFRGVPRDHERRIHHRSLSMARESARQEVEDIPPDTARHLYVRTMDHFARELDPKVGLPVRRKLFEQYFSEGYLIGGDYFTLMLVRVMESEDLDDRERALVRPISDQFSRQIEVLREKQIDGRVRFEASRPSSPFSGPSHESYLTLRRDLSSELEKHREAAQEQLKRALGEERVADVSRRARERSRDQSEYAQLMAWSTRWLLPEVINSRQLDRFARVLALPHARDERLRSAFRDYREAYREVLDEAHAALPFDLNHAQPHAGQAAVRQMHAVQRDYVDRLRAIDAAFFRQLGENDLNAWAIERIEAMRTRQVHVAILQRGVYPLTVPPLDLLTVIADHDAALLVEPDFDAAIRSYEAETSALMADMYRRSKRVIQAQDVRRGAAHDRIHRDPDTEIPDTPQSLEDLRRIVAAGRLLRDLNLTTLDELISALPDMRGMRLLDAYMDARYPASLQDSGAVHDQVQRAAARTDLSDATRQRLRELAVSYPAEYRAIRERIVQLGGAMDRGELARAELHGDDAERYAELLQEYRGQHQRLEHLRFDREQLNMRTRAQLSLLLNGES